MFAIAYQYYFIFFLHNLSKYPYEDTVIYLFLLS